MEERPAGGNSNTSQKNTKSEQTLSTSLDEMMTVFRDIFKNDGTLRIRVFSNMFSDSLRFGLVYVDGMVDKHMIQEGIIKPVMAFDFTEKDCGNKAELMENIRTQVISISDVVASENFDEMIYAIIAGKTLLLMDGYAGVLNIGAQGWETKALAEPVTEKSVKGPREGFTESLLVNLTLIRRRVQDSELKFVFSSLGTRSKTPICICYMEGLASPAILKELQNRMEQIDIDLILDTASLAELIRDEPYSPFEMTGSTERPDAVVSNMMEGRVPCSLKAARLQ